MIKSALWFCFLLFVFPLGVFACRCIDEGVVNDFQKSEFVAKAKLIKITADPVNPDFHDAVIEVIRLYKGAPLVGIKIRSVLRSSCRFLPEVGSTWIIFAQRYNGILSFGLCSGSMRMEETVDQNKYMRRVKNNSGVELKESVIDFLSSRGLFDPNPGELQAGVGGLELFKDFNNKNRFAVFQVDVFPGFLITEISVLQKFSNRRLNRLFFEHMKKNLSVSGLWGKPLKEPARLILFCYFYREHGADLSFLSFLDL